MFEVSERTIHRDLKQLKDTFGAPLTFDSDKNGYCYCESTWNLPSILFTEKELLALLIAKNATLHYTGIPYCEDLVKAFEKIVKYTPKDKAMSLGEIEKMYSFRFSGSRQFNPEILNSISRALKKSNCIKMTYYTASRNEENERIVNPYHLDNLRGDWYLIGHCQLRKDIRVFALNRIRSCYVLGKTFEPDPDFDYNQYIKDAFGIIRTENPVHLAVQFWGFEATLARERNWHESQRIEERPDGSAIIHLHVTGFEEVKRWVLASGGYIKVLEPSWFAEEIKKELEKALNRYK